MPVLLTLWRNPLARKLAAIVAAIVLLGIALHAIDHRGFVRGQTRERASWQKRVAAEDAKNRAIETGLRDALNASEAKRIEKVAERVRVETVYRDRVAAGLYPECSASPDTIDARNSIRNDTALPE